MGDTDFTDPLLIDHPAPGVFGRTPPRRAAAAAGMLAVVASIATATAEPAPNDLVGWVGPYADMSICVQAEIAVHQPLDCVYRTDQPGGPGFYYYRHY